MNSSISYILISQSARFTWLSTFLSKHHTQQTYILFSTTPQAQFFKSVYSNLSNINLDNVRFEVFSQLAQQSLDKVVKIILMDVPNTFETLKQLMQKLNQNAQLILVLYDIHKNYIKIIQKKFLFRTKMYTFNKNKLLTLEDKLIKMVDSNYDLNRGAFYAYGSYLKYLNSNKLKHTFKTDRLDVHAIARTFGFTIAPRVKLQAKFLTKAAQIQKKKSLKKTKLVKVKQAQVKSIPQVKETKKVQKVIRTKKILKKSG